MECDRCHGDGYIEEGDDFYRYALCTRCAGTGKQIA